MLLLRSIAPLQERHEESFKEVRPPEIIMPGPLDHQRLPANTRICTVNVDMRLVPISTGADVLQIECRPMPDACVHSEGTAGSKMKERKKRAKSTGYLMRVQA